MFPRDFFIDYWNPALRDEVFVAMPFATEFTDVWEQAISPAIIRCGLKPFRVDIRKASDSILVDILDGVAHARLILVDLSPVHCPQTNRIQALFSNTSQKPQFPNENVMYELGLAHATRQAEEVILVRNHAGNRLLFDVSGLRAHSYPSNNLEEASFIFEDLIQDALATVDRTKSLQVGKAIQAITIAEMKLIRKYWPKEFFLYSKKPTDDLTGIPGNLELASVELQRLGILQASPSLNDTEFYIYLSWTEFGNAVVKALGPGLLQGRSDPLTPPNTNKEDLLTSGNNL